jgi:hypothetical protein
MKLHIVVDGAVFATGKLDASPSAADFASLLPLTLHLQDDEATEKIADLPRKLSTEGAPRSCTPSSGDICFYAPWGNIAFFYQDGAFSDGLIRLGRLQSGLDRLKQCRQGSLVADLCMV